MPAEDRAISDFPIALQLLNTALVLISNPDGQGGYDSYQATLTEIGRVVLETQYTQDLGNVDVFDAIKNCRVLSGTTTPTSLEGADGQLYVKYSTSGNDTSVVGLYVKLSGAWAEIATGGSGDVGIECTQAQYDAWEQAGTLLQDTNYYITDGQSGGGVTIDDITASASTVYSSLKTQGVFDSHDDDFADAYDDTATYNEGDYCIYNNTLYKCSDDNVTGTWDAQYWDDTTIAEELNELNTETSANFDYSANEVVIGDYFGYPLYRKYFDVGQLPNNSTRSVVVLNQHIRDLINLRIVARTTAGDSFITIPYLSSNSAFNIECDVECTGGETKVNVTTHTDRTGLVAFGIIEYLKPTS